MATLRIEGLSRSNGYRACSLATPFRAFSHAVKSSSAPSFIAGQLDTQSSIPISLSSCTAMILPPEPCSRDASTGMILPYHLRASSRNAGAM